MKHHTSHMLDVERGRDAEPGEPQADTAAGQADADEEQTREQADREANQQAGANDTQCREARGGADDLPRHDEAVL